MTDAPQPRLDSGHESEGRPAAIIAWALYILSIPSANLLVIVGLIVAYAGRGTATGLPRQHIEAQIALFWSVFWWTVGLWIGILISIPLMMIGVGILTLCLCALALFVLHVWFTIKSILSLVNLLSDNAP